MALRDLNIFEQIEQTLAGIIHSYNLVYKSSSELESRGLQGWEITFSQKATSTDMQYFKQLLKSSGLVNAYGRTDIALPEEPKKALERLNEAKEKFYSNIAPKLARAEIENMPSGSNLKRHEVTLAAMAAHFFCKLR